MARYRTADGRSRFHDGILSYPPGSEIDRPDDEAPSLTFVPLDEAARAAMEKRLAEVRAKAEKRAVAAEKADPMKAEKIRAEAEQKIKDAENAVKRTQAEADLVTPVRMAPQSMAELALQRPRAAHEPRRRDKGQG